MECGHKNQNVVSKDEVIAKLKDDGDFDKLRLKIIRNLKDDEQLRENISSIVKQSAALNRLGAENMKPRQLSDAIYQDVGEKVMSQISDGLWGIIRSNDGMKSEIKDTVQSVYRRLTNTEGKVEVESSTSRLMPVRKKDGDKDSVLVPATKAANMLSENEPKEPPGFSLSHNHLKNKVEVPQTSLRHEKRPLEEQQGGPLIVQKKRELGDVDHSQTPGFPADHKQPGDCSDDDPDVPPGFG
ncbi:hypothetical protein TorRG33x02_274210 [Trema orientale]|uniref:Uncharacterized protein n=1 Tax=Trema orientale TaxID=63057 RepID=A0A2P5CSQ3_TREOI|nr:hypothetical protein TorRG33x02_274210 [Trema orientale]